ncbi:protein of unknown function [Rhodovastum atsumiense]|uniref:hypothetical protein n=1 Tax=Rhodovastum atsumiense TaxID=504468 RepID=UPI00193B426C|nr:hypothetical protein [Rhodovastum atsumiense]CAH2600060.1 protein of unknown function [Rhodovastum atsumiense]
MANPRKSPEQPSRRTLDVPAEAPAGEGPALRMSRKDYEAALRPLHVELVKLQRWVVHRGAGDHSLRGL